MNESLGETVGDHIVDPDRYTFTTLHAPRRLEWVYRDTYRHLGWVLDAFDPDGHRNPAVVTLRFRRAHELASTVGLADLQQRADAALAVIAARERVKAATVHSSTALAAIVGSAAIVGGVLTVGDGDVLTPALLIALGVVTWLIGGFGRRHLAEIAATRFGLGNEQEYATVLAVGRQADRLLAEAVGQPALDLRVPCPTEPAL